MLLILLILTEHKLTTLLYLFMIKYLLEVINLLYYILTRPNLVSYVDLFKFLVIHGFYIYLV